MRDIPTIPSEYVASKEQEHLVPVPIPNKMQYYADLANIEHSSTGRLDVWLIAYTFISESVRLLINALCLFEKGYFDCAFYSLRQSLEISTTLVYLVDADDEARERELSKWEAQSRFPMHKEMMELLSKKGHVFQDMKDKLGFYFERLERTKSRLNKHVHKQGFDKFYVSRNHITNSRQPRDEFRNEFEEHLKTCIGAVAVFRLAIDPFPVMLHDEEVYYRTGDLLTNPYSQEFIEKYIGEDTVQAYKTTQLYQIQYQWFMNHERQSESVNYVLKDQYIDTMHIGELLAQSHLLDDTSLGAVELCAQSEKVCKVYTQDGWFNFWTDRSSVRKKMNWNGLEFMAYSKNSVAWNMPYDEAYLSYVDLRGIRLLMEHNTPFSDEEIRSLREFAKVDRQCAKVN